jgi:hypothetical protein
MGKEDNENNNDNHDEDNDDDRFLSKEHEIIPEDHTSLNTKRSQTLSPTIDHGTLDNKEQEDDDMAREPQETSCDTRDEDDQVSAVISPIVRRNHPGESWSYHTLGCVEEKGAKGYHSDMGVTATTTDTGSALPLVFREPVMLGVDEAGRGPVMG